MTDYEVVTAVMVDADDGVVYGADAFSESDARVYLLRCAAREGLSVEDWDMYRDEHGWLVLRVRPGVHLEE